MERSLLLEKQNRKQWMALAIIFTINGIILMFGEDLVTVRIIVGGAMIILSIFYLIYSFVGYSLKSKYAAKIRTTYSHIEIKPDFWKPTIKLNWNDIKRISFGNYKVEFSLPNETKTVNYDTTAELSIQLKQLIRESAEQQKIEVIGG